MNFSEDNIDELDQSNENEYTINPEYSDIYISTKTKISYLNTEVDLNSIFWKLPIINYHIPKEDILKKL